MSRKLIIIRHGESVANVDNSFYKLPDSAISLTPIGIKQSIAASEIIKPYFKNNSHSLSVFSSDYTRAKQTGRIVMDKLQDFRNLNINSSLNEINVHKQETLEYGQFRSFNFFKNIIVPLLCEQDVILFSHHNIMKSLFSKIFELSDFNIYSINLDFKNAKPYIFNVDLDKLINYDFINSFELQKLTKLEEEIYKEACNYKVT